LRKLILLSTALLLTLSLTSVYAKNDNVKTNNSKANRNVQNLEDADQDPDEVGGVEESTTSQSPSEAAKSRNAIRKLEQIKVTATTPEMEEEIDEVVEEQEEVQDTVDDAIVEVDQRPSFVKFLIGPDFKNLGQLRKEVVQTRNNIRKLERVREKVTEEEQTAIDEAITELETNALNLQASIGEKLEGFSLFGWLFRWLSDFDAPEEPDVSPTPSAEPTASPEVSASPTATPSASLSPTASPAEEETPSSTGIAD
jgi:hypothetical protein